MRTAQVTHIPWRSADRTADRARERRLFLRWQRFRDERARDELVAHYLPLVRDLARRYRRERDGLDDLTQVASIGLLKAIDRFDPGRGFAFSTFAVPTITGELKRYARDFGWTLHLPRCLRDRAVKLRRAEALLAAELGRPPTLGELAATCDLTPAETLEALEADATAEPCSLEAGGQVDTDADAGVAPPAADEEGYEAVEDLDAFARRMESCSERDRAVLRMRLIDGLSQREIGNRVGVSQMQVSRILRSLLDA